MIFKKSAIITLASILLAIVLLLIYLFQKSDTLETAIRQYEKKNYIRSITILNTLIQTAEYEEAEKIYYYRCRAINDLAIELERKNVKYLKAASMENRGTPGFEKAHKKIEETLASVNSRISGDLQFAGALKMSRITSRGGFYNEFLSRYKGSPFLEDLDFFEITRINSTAQENLFQAIGRFYSKFPNSAYTPQIVAIIFDALRDGITIQASGDAFIQNMLFAYIKQYPTSQEASRIFISDGDGVNLRNSPGLNGDPIGKTVKDEILIQLEKSMDTMQIGDHRDYWYRVATLRGVNGWIYGKFLKAPDTSSLTIESVAETWNIDDHFNSWSDSNTPENWVHLNNSAKNAINFRKENGKNLLVLNSEKGAVTGLYNRYSSRQSFTLRIKARFISGDPVFAAAISADKSKTFYINLHEKSVDVNGRIIPLDTAAWHVYEIISADMNFAELRINGEMVAGRIPPFHDERFNQPGTYLVKTSPGSGAACEVEYIKIR